MFLDTDINVGYETWHLRIAPLDAFGSPIVTITERISETEEKQHFQGTEEEAFHKLVSIMARQHYDSLAKVDKVPEKPAPVRIDIKGPPDEINIAQPPNHSSPEKVPSSASIQPKQGGSHARPQSPKK